MPRQSAKLALLSRYILRPARWGRREDAWSKTIPHDHPAHHLPKMLRTGCHRGLFEVSHVISEKTGKPVGMVVWSVEEDAELLVRAAAGKDLEPITAELDPLLCELARQQGCKTIRFHTMRPGLIQISGQHGYHISEIIMRKAVPHG